MGFHLVKRMRLPLSELKTFLSLDKSAKEISAICTLLGMEVEKEETTPLFKKVVCAQIEKVSFHPKSKNLLLLTLSDGKKSYQVVCSDVTCKKGQRVAYAKEGATLSDEKKTHFVVEKRFLQEELSEGMLVSSKELGLSEEHLGVYTLDETVSLGEDLYPLLSDTVLEISLTPNLGHCQSVLGIAREIGAYLSLPLKKPKVLEKTLPEDPKVSVEMEKGSGSTFALRTLEKIKVGASPFWLKRKLELFGLRSINNVVDITNYLLMLYGQPLHAYDYETFDTFSFAVKEKKEGKFFGLDKNEIDFEESLCVMNGKTPVSLAGVMGDVKHSVSLSTHKILLEAAHFSYEKIRKTLKSTKLRTESSIRSEKGTDPEVIFQVLDHASFLLQELAGAKAVFENTYQKKEPVKKILLRASRAEKLLGIPLSLSEIEDILSRLRFSFSSKKEGVLEIEVPSYRYDISLEIDVIEEIARIHGFNHFSLKAPKIRLKSLGHHPLYVFEKRVRTKLISQGMQELLTTDLIRPGLAKLMLSKELTEKNLLQVAHAKSEEYSILRPSLLGSHLQVIQHNLAHRNFTLLGFETSNIHRKKEEDLEEQKVVALCMTGLSSPSYFTEKTQDVTFFDLKGILENLFSGLGISNVRFAASSHASFHPNCQANLWIEEEDIGVIGEVHPDLLAKMDITQKVYFSEMNLSALMHYASSHFTMKELPNFPGSARDVTLTLSAEMPIQTFFDTALKEKSSLLEKVEIIDLYESEKLGKNKKNYTFRFYYRDLNHTLSFEEAEKEHQKVTEKIRNQLKEYIAS